MIYKFKKQIQYNHNVVVQTDLLLILWQHINKKQFNLLVILVKVRNKLVFKQFHNNKFYNHKTNKMIKLNNKHLVKYNLIKLHQI